MKGIRRLFGSNGTKLKKFREWSEDYGSLVFIILYPIALSPILIGRHSLANRCLFVICLMTGYTLTHVMPYAVIGLIPIPLFPFMNILSTNSTCRCYFRAQNIYFIGASVMKVAMMNSKLSRRIGLLAIVAARGNLRLLSLLPTLCALLLPIIVPNVVAGILLATITEEILKELESEGLCTFYEKAEDSERRRELSVDRMKEFLGMTRNEDNKQAPKVTQPGHREGILKENPRNTPQDIIRLDAKPSRITTFFHLSIIYTVSYGGTLFPFGTIVDQFKNELGLHEHESVGYWKWLCLSVPIALANTCSMWVILQVALLGLFRARSVAARQVEMTTEMSALLVAVVKKKLKDMGRQTFPELATSVCIILYTVAMIYLVVIPDEDLATNILIVTYIEMVLLFLLPSNGSFIYMFAKDKEKRPTKASPPLITWEQVKNNIIWDVIFVIGGVYTLRQSMAESGLDQIFRDHVNLKESASLYDVITRIAFLSTFVTQMMKTEDIFKFIFPLVRDTHFVNPIMALVLVTFTSSYTFSTYLGSSVNVALGFNCNITGRTLAIYGICAAFISCLICTVVFIALGQFIY